MATTVDTLLVRIEADMADLKRDVARATSAVEGHANRMAGAFRMVAGAVAAIGGGALFGSFIRDTINTGAQIEGLRVQLDALLGSAEQGARAFDKMSEFAARVPFSLEQIQAGSGSLAAASDNADQLGELLQVTGNIASQFNIPFDQAAENVQRAMSAGAASADLFQQKGVNAFMGFEAGVSYSASETAKKLIEHFGTGGTSDGAMDQFARTTGGALSMFGDAMFNFRRVVAESGLNEGFVELTNVITDMLRGSDGLASTIGQKLGAAFSTLAGILRRVYNASSEIAAVFTSVIDLGKALVAALLAAFGLTVQDAINAVQIALNAIIENMNVLIPLVVAYVTIRFAKTMGDSALAAYKLAVGLKSVGMTQRIVNIVTKRGIGTWIAIAALFGEITGLTDGLVERLGAMAQRVYDALPEELRGSIDDVAEGFEGATASINAAYDAINQRGPMRIEVDGSKSTSEVIDETTRAIQAALAAQGGSAAGAQKEFDKLKTSIEGMQPEYVKLEAQIDAITAALPSLNGQLREQAQVALVQLKEQLRSIDPLYNTLKDATIQLGQSIGSAFADALVEGKNAMEGLKDSFKQFVKVMIAKALELYVFNHIINAVFGLRGSAALPTRTMFAATGGMLQPNVPTVVGERGPELIVPSTSGSRIMNSNNTRGAMGGGGSPIIVNQHINVSAGVAPTVRAEMMTLLPAFKQQAISGVLDAKRRGGSFGQAFG